MATKQTNRHPRTDWTADGTELHLVRPLVRTKNKPLYTSEEGIPYTRVRRKYKHTGVYVWKYLRLKPGPDTTANSKFNSGRKQRYLKLSYRYGNILISHAVCLAWNGPRRVDNNGRAYECHHLNGITTDNRACNLIWLSQAKHRKYDARQKQLQELLGDLRIYSREDFDRWHAMPEKEFQAMINKYHRDPNFDQMEWDMTHHCEC